MSLTAYTPYNHFLNYTSLFTLLTLLYYYPLHVAAIFSSVSILYYLLYVKLYCTVLANRNCDKYRNGRAAILITGCSSGIGAACAKHFICESRYHVLATFRREADVDRFREEYLGNNQMHEEYFTPLLLDVTDTASLEKNLPTLRRVHEKTPIFCLINNSGLQMSTIVENMDIDGHIRNGFDVNVLGVYRMVKIMLPFLRDARKKLGRARIITMSSMAAMVSLPSATAYSSSKWAAQAISQGLRNEVKRFGIETCTINPGSIRTNFRLNAKRDLEKYLSSANRELQEELYPEYFALWKSKYEDNFKHGEGYEKGKGMSVDVAVRLVEKTVETSHLQQSYFLGKEGTLVSVLSILPQWVTDMALRKQYRV